MQHFSAGPFWHGKTAATIGRRAMPSRNLLAQRGLLRLLLRLALLLGAAGSFCPARAEMPQAPPSLPRNVSENEAGVLRGTIPNPVARNQARLVAPLDPATRMQITIALLPPERDELERLAAEVNDPRSPNFRKFLSFDEWKSSYAPTDADVDAIAAWAHGAGLAEVYRFPSNMAIVLEGSVGAIETALHLQLSQYEFAGHRLYGNNRPATLPAPVAGRVDTIFGLDSFTQSHPAAERHKIDDIPAPRAPKTPFISTTTLQHDGSSGPRPTPRRMALAHAPVTAITGPLQSPFIEPPDLWSSQAYDYDALSRLSHCCNPKGFSNGSPKEMSIAIVGNNRPRDSDLIAFFSVYGLAANILEFDINGASCCDLEMTIDVEWAGATSNSFGAWQQTSRLFVYEGSGTLLADTYTALSEALATDNARILTLSYASNSEDSYAGNGGVNSPPISAFRGITVPMLAMGYTIIVAAGDDGAYANCSSLSIDYPASDPAVIAAGGTTLNLKPAGGGLQFIGEAPWTGNGCQAQGGNGGGGGGGCSDSFFAPPWQTPVNKCAGSRRAIPDISLNAGFPQVIYYLGGWTTTRGTSIVAPELAGFTAQAASYLAYLELAGQTCRNGPTVHCVPVGHLGPAIYAEGSGRAFYPGSPGCNGGGVGQGFCTAPGYNLAVGWGSANMLQLAWTLNRWIGAAPGPHTGPQIAWQGPPTAQWYATDQIVSFQISGGTLGIAGYTAQWDQDPGDPVHTTPGAGDPYWDGPKVVGNTSGSFSLAAAGVGCHTAFVRAWDNEGFVSTQATSYGPICFGAPPNCSIAFQCVVSDNNPPAFTVSCASQEDFYETFSDGSQTSLGTLTSYSGTSSLYGNDILACTQGTNNCIGFSIFVSISQWCKPSGPLGPSGPHPPSNCRACIEAGGYCGPNNRCQFQ
jgi:hypothetical protein